MKNIIIISGVEIDKTPIIKSLTNYLVKQSIVFKTIEYNSNRFQFIIKGIFSLLKLNRNDICIFVGAQSLPILFFTQFSISKKIYWELETYHFSFLGPLVDKILIFKHIINWNNKIIIYPLVERLSFGKIMPRAKNIIIENVPPNNRQFIQRKIENERIKLLLYGNLNSDVTYIKEWIDLIKGKNNVQLDLFGWAFNQMDEINNNSNIKYKGNLRHDELLLRLNEYHFTIIGYKPIDFNHKFCAPNKLFESLSLSIPVICNNLNPTLVRYIEENENIGFLYNFSNLSAEFSVEILIEKYKQLNIGAYDSYQNKYNFEKIFKKSELFEIFSF